MDSALLRYVLVFLANAVVISAQSKRICYYSSWSIYRDQHSGMPPEKIDPFLCTHIVFAFATLDDSGTKLLAPEGLNELKLFRRFQSLREENEDLNFLIGLGGWDHNGETFHKLMSSEKNMQTFAKECIAFLRSIDFDGLDISWFYPGVRGSVEEDKEKYYNFLRLMKWEFDHEEQPDNKWTMSLSITVNPKIDEGNLYYNSIPKYARYVNWVNFLAYDLYGDFDDDMYAKHHSALYSSSDPNNVNNLARYWINRGVPRHKFVLGVSLIGKSYMLADRHNNRPGAACIGPGYDGGAGYPIKHLCHFIRHGAKEIMDPETRVPHMVRGSEWIGYDNPASAKQKAAMVRRNRLGGIAVFTLDADDYNGLCGPENKNYPMLNAILDGLHARHGYLQNKNGIIQDKAQHAAAKKEIYRQRRLGWDTQDMQEKIHNQQQAANGGPRFW